jgi:DNA-binding NarL/FixJ family response regulator
MMAYEESLKVYRDLKAVTDTAYGDGYKDAEKDFKNRINEAVKKQEEAVKNQEEALKKQEEAVKKQEEAVKKQEEERKLKEEERTQKENAIKLMVQSGIEIEIIAKSLQISVDYIKSIIT